MRPNVTQTSYKHSDNQMPVTENGNTKNRPHLISITSSDYASHIISVEDEVGVALRGRLVRGGHSCSCQCTGENSSGRGQGHCKERQPPLVCDISTLLKIAQEKTTGESYRGETRHAG